MENDVREPVHIYLVGPHPVYVPDVVWGGDLFRRTVGVNLPSGEQDYAI